MEDPTQQEMIKRWKHLKFKAKVLFHLFQDNHVGFYMYITTNYQFLLSARTEARNSEEVVVQQTPAYYFLSAVKLWDLGAKWGRMIKS